MTTEPYYRGDRVTLFYGDCLDVMRELPDCSVDSVCTDPPYGLAEHRRSSIEAALMAWLTGDREHVPDGRGFMGRDWDRFVPPPAVWDQCFRVLKPGGHLLAFAGTRTVDLMGISIRLAGLTTDTSPQIRDSIAWLFGNGLPKSHDVSKAIDRAAGARRQSDIYREPVDGREFIGTASTPVTVAAARWAGWGTGLRPSFEPIVVARKPLVGTVASNVEEFGTGALNIDGSRIAASRRKHVERLAGSDTDGKTVYGRGISQPGRQVGRTDRGRYPPNVVLDEDTAALVDQQAGTRWLEGQSGPSRTFPVFRYEAKAPGSERLRGEDGTAHPTVKPLGLMRWLVRLVTPPGGVVLEPFAGSGTTVEACLLEGFRCIAVEREAVYLPLILQRISKPLQPGIDFGASDSAGGGVA